MVYTETQQKNQRRSWANMVTGTFFATVLTIFFISSPALAIPADGNYVWTPVFVSGSFTVVLGEVDEFTITGGGATFTDLADNVTVNSSSNIRVRDTAGTGLRLNVFWANPVDPARATVIIS